MIIATVLKSGGEYAVEHVHRLQGMIYNHIPHSMFVCFTDMDPCCQIVRLKNNFPGWWSKMELFRMPGPLLYFDLDTIILKDMQKTISNVDGKAFVILRDFYRGKTNPLAMQSSVMYWSGDMSWLYLKYVTDPVFVGGDQEYIEKHVRGAEYWQDFTDAFASYKVDIVTRGVRESDECVVFKKQ